MRQITLNECDQVTGGAGDPLFYGAGAIIGAFTSAIFSPHHPQLNSVLATIGGGVAGGLLLKTLMPGYGIFGAIAGAIAGFYASTNPATTHLVGLIGGAATGVGITHAHVTGLL